MNIVEELIEKEYISSGVFHYNNEETLKNENGTFRKMTLETNCLMGKTIICFEYVRLQGQWACSSTHLYRGEYRGALLGKKALATQSKIIRALEKMDKDKR
jgi:hypothetical protein